MIPKDNPNLPKGREKEMWFRGGQELTSAKCGLHLETKEGTQERVQGMFWRLQRAKGWVPLTGMSTLSALQHNPVTCRVHAQELDNWVTKTNKKESHNLLNNLLGHAFSQATRLFPSRECVPLSHLLGSRSDWQCWEMIPSRFPQWTPLGFRFILFPAGDWIKALQSSMPCPAPPARCF